MKTVYVDNNATTAIAPEVLEVMQPYLTTDYFNPSSMYETARNSARAIQQARETIANCLGGVDPEQILFTGSATESNNAALFGTRSMTASKLNVDLSIIMFSYVRQSSACLLTFRILPHYPFKSYILCCPRMTNAIV